MLTHIKIMFEHLADGRILKRHMQTTKIKMIFGALNKMKYCRKIFFFVFESHIIIDIEYLAVVFLLFFYDFDCTPEKML